MSFLSSLFGVPEEQARGEELDAQLAQINTADYGAGGRVWWRIYETAFYEALSLGVGVEEADSYATNIANGKADLVANHLSTSKTGNVELQLAGAAVTAPLDWLTNPALAWENTKAGAGIAAEAVGTGAGAVVDTLADAILKALSSLFKRVPFYVWLLAGVGAFLYFGGFARLKRKLQ